MNRQFEIDNGIEVCCLNEPDLPLEIGTQDKSHIRLEADFGLAAYVGEDRNYLFLQPAGTGVVIFHNDEQITQSVWLKSGDTTRIGEDRIHWQISGQRVAIKITRGATVNLQPPAAPPDNLGEPQVQATPKASSGRSKGRHLRTLLGATFIVLLAATAFVLMARPLSIKVTPSPDHIDISGFPPVVSYGSQYLGIIGDYTLRAEKLGYRTLHKNITITGRDNSYAFAMEKLPGLLDVSSNPTEVTVLVDGRNIGSTPLQNEEIPAGTPTIRFEKQRYLPEEMVLEVHGQGEKTSLEITLEPAWAVYALQTDPEGATVIVDDMDKGVTPLELELISGRRKVTFTKGGFTPLSIELDVEIGKDRAPAVYRLTPAPATLAINTVPAGATLTTDGVYRGRTPVELSLASNTPHELRLSAAGYKPATRTLTLAPEQQSALSVQLDPEYGTVFINATPPDATLKINGIVQEQATGRFRLTTRAQDINLSAEGYQPVSRTVTPQAGYSQKLEIVLKRKTRAATEAPKEEALITQTALGQRMVLLKPRPFRMGASRSEPGRRANESEHEVLLQRHFYLSEREVTNAEYLQFKPQHSSGVAGNRSLETGSHPVVNVTWEDAARFTNWLSQKDGLPPYYTEKNGVLSVTDKRGSGYRLPTEAEWAYAARMAGSNEKARYPWPGKFPPQKKAGNFADETGRYLLPVVIEGYNDGFAASAPTGSFSRNPAGLYDLGGNVAEWCHDYYTADSSTNETDPTGPAAGSHHVVRGSSWRDASITELRYSYRRYSREAVNDIGFRIARYAQ